jgi:hypothetical protein
MPLKVLCTVTRSERAHSGLLLLVIYGIDGITQELMRMRYALLRLCQR